MKKKKRRASTKKGRSRKSTYSVIILVILIAVFFSSRLLKKHKIRIPSNYPLPTIRIPSLPLVPIEKRIKSVDEIASDKDISYINASKKIENIVAKEKKEDNIYYFICFINEKSNPIVEKDRIPFHSRKIYNLAVRSGIKRLVEIDSEESVKMLVSLIPIHMNEENTDLLYHEITRSGDKALPFLENLWEERAELRIKELMEIIQSGEIYPVGNI